MRIAFDHQIFGWQEYGGISRYAFETASHIARMPGCEVTVFTPFYVNRYLAARPPQLRLVGRPIRNFPRAGRIFRAVNGLMVRPMLRRHAPDIVHETYFQARSIAPRRAKTVLTVYDMIHERFPQHYSRFDPTRRQKAAAVKRADHVICISESTRRDLIHFTGVAPEKTTTILLGYTLTGYSDSETIAAAERPFILHVGLRGGYKNYSSLLAAYAASPRLRTDFDLLAFGGGDFSNQEIDDMRRFGLDTTRVRQMPGNDRLLSQLYQSATMFVLPSLYEGFGIPPLEAMDHGCPVVCGATSSLPEVVGDAARIVDAANPDSLREAIEAVAYSSEIRSQLIARGKERVRQFSWDRCARQTVDVYQRLLQS
jgi:glycosyltransferase involved in cell wall biosynthesis